MDWTFFGWPLIAAGVAAGLALVQVFWLAAVLTWGDEATAGLGYYDRSPEGRRRFRRRLRLQARLLQPALRIMARLSSFAFDDVSFRFRSITGPQGACDEESFRRGAGYDPAREDVFVVGQMRSGTTWAQHLIYEVLHRGDGDLAGRGTALHAVSAWLESRKTVAAEDAPVLGEERPSRLIRTHFPADLCPFREDARYVYVARHPVSCFASCADLVAANAGPLAPDLETVERWFCSEEMWWGPWPDHVEGWWRRAEERENVLFLYFEEMKDDLAAAARRLADFLGLSPLTDEEVERMLGRCTFEYMREHLEAFEVPPPHLLSVEAELFREETRDRHRDVPDPVRRRVASWCAGRLDGGRFPLAETYPDVGQVEPTGT